MKLLLGSVLALALVVGCKSSDPNAKLTSDRTTASSNSKAGWTEVSASGVKISFPADWVAMDLTKGDFEKMFDSAAQKDPASKQMIEMAKQFAASGLIKLLVFDPANTAGGFARNVNLVVAPSLTKSIDEELNVNKQQFAMMAPKAKVEGKVVDLPAGRCGLLESTMPGPTGDRLTLGYMFLHGKDTYVITFTDLAIRGADVKKKAEEIMKTFKVD